ncbi:HlyD family efflux transporter periplasmic adaptor subunit [Pseudarthrobacter sp. PS3-L1]|uniref:HlyD family efflux transporter periplasmic adaptor subunit n=1 Tax=Pseudarthrobacter sp. PS3-L1 TaxID=3046207 RepID=UPI0024BB1033|nr:HlyD family efflux transporter periplasmic adaptor subunit [Pseudarthrobacter sp. PS3-L1]MDJ0320737.1 biotin/lipoyl-binding protein [Pseudarthrobacter sp. PS3-L1]
MLIRKVLTMLAALVLILTVSGAGLVYANDRSHHLSSNKAVLRSESYSIGTPFGGAVQHLSVSRGDSIKKGQELFRLQSATLQQALATSRFNATGVGYSIIGDDVMVFTATNDGVVSDLGVAEGSFVPANSAMAQIDLDSTLIVEATFDLTPRDYSKVAVGSVLTVGMPDNSSVDAEVFDIQVTSNGANTAQTLVLAKSRSLAEKSYFSTGAPVTAELKLKDDENFGSWLARQLTKLATPSGTSS